MFWCYVYHRYIWGCILASVCVCVCVCVWGGGVGGAGLWSVSKVESPARAPCLLMFILLVSFSGTLLVVSILDISFYDCHLRPLLQS